MLERTIALRPPHTAPVDLRPGESETAPDSADACFDETTATSTPASVAAPSREDRRTADAHRYFQLLEPRDLSVLTAAARDVADSAMPRNLSSSCSHRIRLPSVEEAKTVFGRAVDGLLDVSSWDEGLSPLSADFSLYSSGGSPAIGRAAVEGDFVRVDLPGNPIDSWVRIESVVVEDDRVSIRVRPSYDPTERPVRPEVTAHFFESSATNTFTLERRGDRVRFSVEGRNETPNVGRESGVAAMPLVRRAETIGAWGAVGVGLQHNQWDELTRSLLERAR